MKKLLTLLFAASAFLFACNSSESGTESETTDTTTSSAPASVDGYVPPPEPLSAPSMDNSGAMTTPPAPSSVPPSSPQPQVTATAPGMNPPHGEPGHRCEIAVGAPLNSAPAPATSQAPSSPTVVTSPNLNASSPTTIQVPPSPSSAPTTPPAPTTATAPGMNPPHGQPGHDCAVPVGSPLPVKK